MRIPQFYVKIVDLYSCKNHSIHVYMYVSPIQMMQFAFVFLLGFDVVNVHVNSYGHVETVVFDFV